MRRSIRIPLTILMVAVMATPAALASWSGLGTTEPDTLFDKQGSFMFPNPNTDPVDSAYLNVVPMQRQLEVNPNTATLGSRMIVPGNMGFDAIFGSWIDCNRDGYVGHLESVLIEYPVELLPADSPCANLPMYNSFGWVSELRWFSNPYATNASYAGFDSADPDPHPDGRDGRAIKDYGATIWGDYGRPGDLDADPLCPRNVQHGSMQRTGAALQQADCFSGYQAVGVANAALGPAGMGFESGSFDEAGHPLNLATFGEDNGEDTVVQVWDCDAEPQYVETGAGNVETPQQDVEQPVGGDTLHAPWFRVTDEDGTLSVVGYWANDVNDDQNSEGDVFFASEDDPYKPGVTAPSPNPSPNAGGTVAGTYNATQNSDCEGTNSIYSFEAAPPVSPGKTSVDIRFTYYEEQRNGPRRDANPFYGTFIYPGVRSGLLAVVEGTHWYSEGNAPSEFGYTLPQLVRSSSLEPQGAIYWSFYANLTVSGVQTPGGVGVYGSEWCSISTNPLANGGFECNDDLWYKPANGERASWRDFYPMPGHEYQLRDVDCYDGTIVAGVPAQASLVIASTEGGCPAIS